MLATGPRQIGIYRTPKVEITSWGIRFQVEGAGFFSSMGFAYAPNPRAVAAMKKGNLANTYESFRHVWGDWYEWSRSMD
jgi:hypothetical protein